MVRLNAGDPLPAVDGLLAATERVRGLDAGDTQQRRHPADRWLPARPRSQPKGAIEKACEGALLMSTLASVGPGFVLGEFANDSALLAATSPGRLGLFSLASFGLAFFLFAIARWWFPFLNACSSNESSILFDDDPSGLTVELRRVLSVVLYVGSAVLVVVGLVQAALALIGVVSG